MNSKLMLLLEDEDDDQEKSLSTQFSWTINRDGSWDYKNSIHTCHGYFVEIPYRGAYNSNNPTDLELHLGDIVGIKDGQCWRARHHITKPFDLLGIVVGWYDHSDIVIVQISGIITMGKEDFTPGRILYLTTSYGCPVHLKSERSSTSIGIALTKNQMLFFQKD